MQQGPNLFARGENLTQEGIDLCFSRVAGTELADFVDVGNDEFLEGAEDAPTLGEGGLFP